jgi:hypothetical protein
MTNGGNGFALSARCFLSLSFCLPRVSPSSFCVSSCRSPLYLSSSSFSIALLLSLISPGNEINYANSRFALSPITPPRQIALRGFVVGHKVSNARWNARRRVLLKLCCSCDKTVFHMLTLQKTREKYSEEIARGRRATIRRSFYWISIGYSTLRLLINVTANHSALISMTFIRPYKSEKR